jgi:hypothetical protein
MAHGLDALNTVFKAALRRRLVQAKLAEVKEELRHRRHQSIPEQGKWLAHVVAGFFNYHAVPTNFAAFAHYTSDRHRCRWPHGRRNTAGSNSLGDRYYFSGLGHLCCPSDTAMPGTGLRTMTSLCGVSPAPDGLDAPHRATLPDPRVPRQTHRICHDRLRSIHFFKHAMSLRAVAM